MIPLSRFSSLILPIVPFSGFIGLSKPVLPILPRHSSFVPYVVTLLTISSHRSRVFWEKVSFWTMRFPGILRCYSLPSKYVLFFSHKIQMCRITAGSVATKMIYLLDSASWYWLHKYRVDYPMYSFSPALKPQKSVTPAIFRTSPFPTTSLFVYRYLLKYSFVFLYTKLTIYKVHGIIIPHGRLVMK